jgi:nucleotide-binding universal stress UspA family protein/quercetin dioxygenase-like cupin family protein
MPAIKIILHPTDFSDSAEYAFLTACSLAKEHQARLILLHVVPPLVSFLPESVPNPSLPAEAQRSVKWRFSWPLPADPTIAVEHRVAEGDAAEEILRMAESLHCDLIVMGTEGRTGLKRLLLGSVAEEVMRKARCPVMPIKMPQGFRHNVQTSASSSPVEVVDVRPFRSVCTAFLQTDKLVHSDEADVFQVLFPSGESLAEETGETGVIVHCLEGRVALSTFGRTQTVNAGQLVYLRPDVSYKIQGIEDAFLLVTKVQPNRSNRSSSESWQMSVASTR